MKRVLIVVVLILVTLSSPTPATATDDFALTLAATPLVAAPGQAVDTSMRVVNRSDRPRTFNIVPVSLETQDDGRTKVVERDDDPWTKAVEVAPMVEVGPEGYVEVPMRIHVPADAPVDIHLVAIAIEPLKGNSPNEIDVQNRVVNHVAVETPGEANRAVEITNSKLPRIVFGSELDASFDVHNTGDTAVKFRGQVYIDSRFGGDNLAVIRTGDPATPELLPRDRSKTSVYKWDSNRLFAAVTPTAEVNFSNGAAGMTSVRATGQTVIMLPVATVIGVSITLVASVLAVWLLLKRRRRSEETPTDSAATDQT